MSHVFKPALGLALAACAAAAPITTAARTSASPHHSSAERMRETARNRAIITDFAHRFYTLRQVRSAFETYVAPDYIQHNPGLADGREAAITMLAPMFADRGHSFAIRHIVVDGDLAAVHIFVKPDPAARGAAVADFYRLKDGKIVEHWDVIQPIPEQSANAHPMF